MFAGVGHVEERDHVEGNAESLLHERVCVCMVWHLHPTGTGTVEFRTMERGTSREAHMTASAGVKDSVAWARSMWLVGWPSHACGYL